MKMIIRSSNGDLREQEVTQDMNFTPTQGEHLYFTGVESYQFQLVNDNSTMNVYFMTNDGEKINIVLNDMAELIQQNNPMDPFSVDTIFGVSTNAQGDQQIDAALHNPEFESGEIIEALKEALSLDGSTVAGGAIIDDFQAMLDNMEATAAGGPEDTAYLTPEEQNQLDELNDAAADEGNPESPEDTPPTNTPPPSNTSYTTATASLSGLDVNEDQNNTTFTLELSQAPFTSMTMVAEINGIPTTYTIPAGTTSFDFDVITKDSDVYVDPDTVTVTIVSLTGGGFDTITLSNNSATITISDTIDTTKVNVTTADVNENEENVTFNFETTNPPQAGTTATLTVEVAGQDYTVTLDANGKGSLEIPSKDVDVYNDEQTVTATVKSINGGNFEATDVTGATASAKVVDFDDEVKITLTATPEVNEDANPEGNFEAGNNITYTASLPNGVIANNDITVTLNVGANGEPASATNTALTITIVAGESFGTVVADAVNRDNDGSSEDKYIETDSLSAAIVSATEANAGDTGSLENLTFDDTPAVTNILNDGDVTTVDITGTITKTSTIDIENVSEELSGVNIYALNKNGEETTLSIDTNPNHPGFGVQGMTSGASQELGYDDATNKSEKIVAEFDNKVESIDVTFSWRNPNEEAEITFINESGEVIGSAIISGGSSNGNELATVTYYDKNGDVTRTETTQGGTDRIDSSYTFEPGDGQTFTKVEFSAPGNDDDYLINKIDYKEVVDVNTPNAVDAETEITLEIQTSNPPQAGTTATATVMVYGVAHSVKLDENGRGTLDVTLQEGKELTAEVTEIVGGNFEAVDVTNASLTLNTPPVADAVLTTSNLDTDDSVVNNFAANSSTPDVEDIAFFKKLDIGGGLDGDITNAENDSSDPADLGGSDIETTENNLVFDITSLPTYGDVYIQVGDVYTKLDASNLDEASTLLDTADTVYWSATHEQVNTYTNTVTNLVQNSIGGDYTSSDIQSSWQSDDVTVIARDENNQEASINYVTNDGIGVSGNTGSGPSNQLGYDPTAQKAESIIFDFKNPATDASVAITHLIQGENGGEVGTFEAFLDGKSLGVFTFSNNSSAGADYTLTAEAHGSGNSAGSNSGTLNIDDLVFDQLRFSAQEYASQGSSTDSSDYFIGGITYHEVPDVEFKYKVIDESNNPSEEVKVVIDVATDTPVPEADTNATPTTTDDSITTPEDTPYILTMGDFGTYSDETEAQKISIESLPTNGVLKLDGIEISANTEISVSDITTGKLSFTPSNDTDNDSSFNFKISDGELWSDAHTTTVNVLAVADIPTASINVEETTSGTGTNITIVTLTKGISHVNYELSDGTKVKIDYPDGTDIKDPTDATKYIDAIEAHTGKDVVGYEIKGGTYIFNQYGEYLREAVDADNSAVPEYNGSITENATYIFGDSSNLVYSVDISAALADTDNSETLTVSISGVPIGAVLSSDIYTLVDNNDGSWDVTVPAGVKTISDTLTMTTSEQHSDLNLSITARATETNENENGLNYKEATASDALINIEITDSTPNIDGDNIVYEEALTNSYDDREMTTGTFKITTEDGLSNISINGTTITESELLDIVATPKVITTTYGEIEINGYDATTGMVNYSYEIKENTTDHTVANQKDSVIDSISIKVTDTDGDTKENTLDVRIVDDIPTVSDQNAHLTFGADGTVTATTTTNLVFTLDVSGSMTNSDGQITLPGGIQTDRLELAKDAILDAVEAYMDQGAVNVNLTLFAETAKMVDFSNATGQQSWMTVTANNFDSFKSIVNNVSNSGIGQYTNYEAAIDETVDSYNIGTPNADKTVAYFLSDGNPTAEFTSANNTNTYKSTWDNNGYDYSDSGDTDGLKSWLDSTYINQWTNFITNNNIEIQALGIGTGIDTSAGSYLAQLAVGNNASVVEVTDPTKLSDTILGNITGTLSGNIFFGADAEGTIDSIKIGDIEYTKPTDSDETTITTTNGGSLTVDFTDGSYTFEAKQSQYDDGDKETFVVKVSDEDGDSATFNLNISMDSVSERFTLTSETSTIDGGTGYDILDLDGHIDLGSIASRIDNIEEINLGDNNSNDTIHIDYEDIIDMTDTDNDLVIRGDNGDTINLDENDGWQRSDTTTNIDGEDFTEYTNTNNNTISVFIDNDLDTTGLN